MNDTIKTILNHRSIRNFLPTEVEDNKLQAILDCTQAAPSSINGQQMSVIVIKDQTTKDKMAQLAGGQPWISQTPVFLVFVADFYRAKLACELQGKELVLPHNMEGMLVGSVDVGLSMGNAIAAAESLGLGTVCIGAVRREPEEVISILNLPEYTFPMVGLCIGYFDKATAPGLKPRFDQTAVVFNETYNQQLETKVSDYDKVVSEYMDVRSKGEDVRGWNDLIGQFYSSVYFPKVSPTLKKQKFKCE